MMLIRSAAAAGVAAASLTMSACGGSQAAAQPTGVSESDVSRIAAAASHHASTSASAPSTGSGAARAGNAASETPASGSPSTSGASSASALPAEFAVPAAAKAHTKEGALAFVKFYWETLDKLDAHPRDGIVPLLGTKDCHACAMQAQAIAKNASAQEHMEGSNTELSGIREAATSTLTEPVFLFNQSESAAVRVSQSGARTPLKPMSLKAAVRLVWQRDHWLVKMYGAQQA